MTTFEVPDIPDDPADMDDSYCVDALKQLRNDRRTKNIAFPRFVAALRASGYMIGVDEYKECEQKPLKGVVHVREGLLRHAYKVLNATRVQGSAQSATTEFAVLQLTEAREDKGYTHADVAAKLTALGIPTAPAAYRTIEQGITSAVPFDTMVTAGRILGVPIGELIQWDA